MSDPRVEGDTTTVQVLEVLEPGLLTTVQDAGRPGLGHLGIPQGGFADPWSGALANLLAGAPAEAPLLEITALGPRLAVLAALAVGLTGADLGAVAGTADAIRAGRGRRLDPGRAHAIEIGEELAFDPTLAVPNTGFRAYLAVPGGLAVPRVLGSAATSLAGGFGGLAGRALRAGDRLSSVLPGPARPSGTTSAPWSDSPSRPFLPPGTVRGRVRVVPLGASRPAPLEHLCSRPWQVAPTSDRMGLRLDGVALPSGSGEALSHGVVRGTIQVPPDGRPIVLLADHQPTGGYPVVGVAADADAAVLGQLAPGDEVRFEAIPLQAALEARRAVRDALPGLARDPANSGAGRWDELWRWARG
ncbi:MAG TPA: biotin-dependent carboxyltransferase family protein [Candidatus Limnocylindrales bacterium]|nr:biotin-dependent carboxyltransferase family protein [Candidatus Limnocylindrales bacterium]